MRDGRDTSMGAPAGFLPRCVGRLDARGAEADFGQQAIELFRWQFAANTAYRRLCEAEGRTPDRVGDWRQIPAVPTVAFKEFELTSIPPAERTCVFHSSGTTEHRPSRHFHSPESLAVYEASLTTWFRRHLLPELPADGVEASGADVAVPPIMLSLTPVSEAVPHSSLAHMLAVVARRFGTGDLWFAGRSDREGSWALDPAPIHSGLGRAIDRGQPVLLLGTAFNFVHLIEVFDRDNRRYTLPSGSRLMETGGYKGRSREMPKAELHAALSRHLGIPDSHIVCEYGMSELSSQAYDRVCGEMGPRRFQFPPWARAQVISPETGREVADGEVGLVRVFDLANVYSVAAVQTEDLGVRRGDGFELVGRAPRAEARGCSLMAAGE